MGVVTKISYRQDMPVRLANAELTDPAAIAAQVTPAIAETVRKRRARGSSGGWSAVRPEPPGGLRCP
jgi:hypothetical protein